MMPQPTPVPIHDIIAPLPLERLELGWVLLLAGAMLALLLGVVIMFSRRPKKRVPSPGELAMEALSVLRSRKCTPYEFGVAVSDILRRYLKDRYSLDALHKTSLEFLESLRKTRMLTEEEKAALAAFLEASDLLKFARADAQGEELDQLFRTAEHFVRAGEERAKSALGEVAMNKPGKVGSHWAAGKVR